MIVARLGDVVGDYVIKSIDHNELMLAGPEGDHLLHLSFARQEPEVQGTTEPAPPQPPRPKAVFIPGITPGFPLLPSSRLTKGRSG